MLQTPGLTKTLLPVQYFWFRHLFTLSHEQSAQCQELVVQLMRDKKYEVQEMAAGTLAGLLKGLSEPEFNALRSELLQQAQQLFPRRQRSGSGPNPSSDPILPLVLIVFALNSLTSDMKLLVMGESQQI